MLAASDLALVGVELRIVGKAEPRALVHLSSILLTSLIITKLGRKQTRIKSIVLEQGYCTGKKLVVTWPQADVSELPIWQPFC